jgi:hypothetical protein
MTPRFRPFALALFLLTASPLATGRVRAAPTAKTVFDLDFATATPDAILAAQEAGAGATKATLTTDPAEEVGGSRSLLLDARTSTEEWNEFFHSRAGIFAPRQNYHVSFDYRIVAKGADTNFYTLFRRTGAKNNDGWTVWKGEPGASGHIQTDVSTLDAANFYLIIGAHHQGALAINHLKITADPSAPPVGLPDLIRTWRSPGGTDYFVDSVAGSDGAAGHSAASAWKTLTRINSGTFAPGDRILLKTGSAWQDYLSPGGSGAAGKPIRIESYGNGPKPRVDVKGKYLATLFLTNTEEIEVRRLDIANTAPVRQPHLAGVLVREDNFGVAHHVELRDLDVHDVFGSNVKDAGGGTGITCSAGGKQVKSRYDGLLIENCHLSRTDRNGIGIGSNWARDDSWFPSLHVVIRGNLLEDIGGDGIVPIGCDGAVVEHNILRGGRMRALDYAAGIWPWSCDNTVIQYNEVSGMKGTNDGEGYDSDYNCRNSLFQYNLSHDNDGGFMLICTDGAQHMPWNIGNSGTVIRYNTSRNDGLHTFNITGPCTDTTICNNAFYVGKGQDVKLVASGDWGKIWPSKTRFTKNLFYVEGKASFDFGGMIDTTFDHNVFYGNITNRPADPHAYLGDPKKAPADTFRATPPHGAATLKDGCAVLGTRRSVTLRSLRDFD